MPNYVLTDADDIVVMRCLSAPFAELPAGYSQHETEEWPTPGSRLVDGAFLPFDPPLTLLRARVIAAVMAERDRRIDGGFDFDGDRFQSRPGDRENIASASQLAMQAAMLGGGEAGDLRWHGGDSDFVWIAEDNAAVAMDAPTVMRFARAAAAMKSACIFNARALKDQADAAPDAAALDAVDISSGWPL